VTLAAHVGVTARGVDARLSVPAGSTLALLGPNGAGKSTVLEALAGLVTPDGGSATHGDVRMYDVPGQHSLPMRSRMVGFVSQSTTLFHTMTVLENVAFGPRSRGATAADARVTAAHWLARVGAEDLAGRRPRTLSGGQARRVAIARALASGPRLVLLDEPFAGLDLESATQIRAVVADVVEGVTTLIATHDTLDAHVLAESVSVLEAGRVVEHGPTNDVLRRPRTAFAARMAGRAFVPGTVTATGLELDGGGTIRVDCDGLALGSRAAIAPLPREVTMADHGVPDTVRALEPSGDLVRVHGSRWVADVEASIGARMRPGEVVTFAVGANVAVEAYGL
jgi:molybdate transport system ATP-binding protein